MKKILYFVLFLIILPISASAGLWQFYHDRGEELPNIDKRAAMAELCGIKDYKMTAGQNAELLDCVLRSGQLGYTDAIVLPYQMYTTTSTQIASSTKWIGNLNPSQNNNFDIGVYGNAWQDIMASGTLRAGYLIGDGSGITGTMTGLTGASTTNLSVFSNVWVGGSSTTTVTGNTLASGVASGYNLGKFYVDSSGNLTSSGTINIPSGVTEPLYVGNGSSTTTINGSSTSTFTYGAIFANNASSKIYLMANGNVGIGTAAPSSLLHVNGSVRTGASFISTNGTVTAPILVSVDDSNTGQYFPAADTIGFTLGGAEKARLDSSGNFGIGTAGPSELLTVGGNTGAIGNITLGDGTTTSTLGFATSTYIYAHPRTDTAGYSAFTINTTGTISNAQLFTVRSNSNPALIVTSSTVSIASSTSVSGAALSVDGSVLFQGNSGGTPVSGAGTRMMWIPAKAAFRAGAVDGTQWDNTNIGTGSVAMGSNNKASGAYSTALGYLTTASAQSSTAMGQQTTASQSLATAMGYYTTASGYESTAMGYYSVASGVASTAIGYYSYSTASGAFSVGDSVTASGATSTALGQFVSSTASNSITFGSGASLSSPLVNSTANSLMVGFNSNLPTLTILGAAGAGTYGNVGIGNSTPADRLSVSGGNIAVGNAGVTSTLGNNFFSIASSSPNFMLGKFYVDSSGNVSASGTITSLGSISGTTISGTSFSQTSGYGSLTGGLVSFFGGDSDLTLYGQFGISAYTNQADSATAIAVKLGTNVSYVTPGAKLLNLVNGTAEKAYFDAFGQLSWGDGSNTSTLGMVTSTYLWGHVPTDTAGLSAFTLNTTGTISNADLLSIRNNGTEKFSVSSAGTISAAYVYSSGSYSSLFSGNGSGTTLQGQANDGATAVATTLNNSGTLATAGSKLVSIQNAGVEKAFFDKDGALSIGDGSSTSTFSGSSTSTFKKGLVFNTAPFPLS